MPDARRKFAVSGGTNGRAAQPPLQRKRPKERPAPGVAAAVAAAKPMPPRRSLSEVIPCKLLPETKQRIADYATALKIAGHTIGTHNLSEQEFEDSGLFHAAIERLRGQQAAFMTTKRRFITDVLDHLKQSGEISGWSATGSRDRHDYEVVMPDGKIAVIEAKGCLDGNNTNISERPRNADEFIVWSLCQNPGADPNKNAWSGIQTRLSADTIIRGYQVDALVIWDMVCNTAGRPCPKVALRESRLTQIGKKLVPPPCIYLFPRTIPDARNNPRPSVHGVRDVQFINALYRTFKCDTADAVQVSIEARANGANTERRSRLLRDGAEFAASDWNVIRRAT